MMADMINNKQHYRVRYNLGFEQWKNRPKYLNKNYVRKNKLFSVTVTFKKLKKLMGYVKKK